MTNKGYTLLEVLLYTIMSAGVMLVALTFQGTFFKANSNSTTSETISSARILIDSELSSSLSAAQSITVPASDNSSSANMTITTNSSSTTNYFLNSGGLFQQQTLPTLGTAIRLTPPELEITALNFTRVNNSYGDGVRYTFTINAKPGSSAVVSSQSVNHIGSGVLVK
jgi:type II secretory pathway pseudopilin PulG